MNLSRELGEAVHANNFDKVLQILQTNEVDVNARDSKGKAALHFARDKSIARLLIQAGAEVNLQDYSGDTPLLAQLGYLLLLGRETSSTGGSERFTHPGLSDPKLLEVITLLLEAGASPNIPNNRGLNSLHLLFDKGGIAFSNSEAVSIHKFMSLLLDRNADVNMRDFKACTPLHYAVKERHVTCANTLIGSGALVDAQDYRRMTPLHHLFNSDNTEMIDLLLKRNADVNAQDGDGRTTLSRAVEVGNEPVVQLLLPGNEPVVQLLLPGNEPVVQLLLPGNEPVVQLLLPGNEPVVLLLLPGNEPVVQLLLPGNEPVVQLLLPRFGTCVNLPDKNNVTPLHLAAMCKGVKLAEMLIRASADLNARDVWNATPLHYAAYAGAPEIVSLLLQAGADPKLTDADGRLPVHYARSRHNYRTASKFAEEYRHDVAKNAVIHSSITPSTATDDTVQSFPVDDDPFTVSVPHSSLYGHMFDSSILPRELRDSYLNAKSVRNVSFYLHRMCLVPGVGQIPTNTEEVEIIKQNVTEFMSKWAEKIAVIDPRFKGTLLPCGSVFDGTKVGDPDEFDYMLELEELARVCRVRIDSDTEYNEVTVWKLVGASLERDYGDLLDGEQFDSHFVMSEFVWTAYRALTVFDYTSVDQRMYVEGLTEETLSHQTIWTAKHGIVTCKLKLKWTGSFYKQLVITVDLVPALPVREWPLIVRKGGLLTKDITSHGCHVVPKDGYWRLSFSRAESLIMASLSQEQKSALIEAKVMLNPTVSCKIILWNDDALDGADETLLPSDVVSTYMLKNLFFHCIEDNAKDTTGRTVTTGEIFNKLFQWSTGSALVPYFFVPSQNFVGKKSLIHLDTQHHLILVAMIINTLLNNAPTD